MKFGALAEPDLLRLLNPLKKQILAYNGGSFIYIFLRKEKVLGLETTYKPNQSEPGMDSQYYADINSNNTLKSKAQEHIYASGHNGILDTSDHASLKMHISINNIAETDDKIIYGLIELLVKEMLAEENNLGFHFKLIKPDCSSQARFNHNDQITIYCDKYSSTRAFIHLANRINDCLLQMKVPVNTQALGMKDLISFNNFVSARFSTNRFLKEYNTYSFFDNELKILFQNTDAQTLDTLPLCAFEMIFNKVQSSDKIKLPNAEDPNFNLSEHESKYVQDEFKKLIANPVNYFQNPKYDFPTPIKTPNLSQASTSKSQGNSANNIFSFFNDEPTVDTSFDDNQKLDFDELSKFLGLETGKNTKN